MVTFQLAIRNNFGSDPFYKPIHEPFGDAEIVNLYPTDEERWLPIYKVVDWHRDLYKLFRSIGALAVSFVDADEEDIDCFFDVDQNITLNKCITAEHFFMNVYQIVFDESIEDTKNQRAKIVKRLSPLWFVTRACWKPNRTPGPDGHIEDKLIVEIDLSSKT